MLSVLLFWLGHTGVHQGFHHQRQMSDECERIRSCQRAVSRRGADRREEVRVNCHASHDRRLVSGETCFEKCSLVPFSECIQEVERQRERHQREEAAKVFLANENASETISLTNTLRKLRTEKQPVMFYVGGMDLLCQLIKDGMDRREVIPRQIFGSLLETTRTAFRVNNGFELFNSHPIIASSTNESLSEATFNLMMVLCDEDGRIRSILDAIERLCFRGQY